MTINQIILAVVLIPLVAVATYVFFKEWRKGE